ncbi:MAG: hypothetical protein ACRBI6_03730 [Acidimicrobiales bacterium]
MGWLDKLRFWRRDEGIDVVEAVDGFSVDGCFTLPDGSPLVPSDATADTDANTAVDTAEPE